MTTHDIVQYVLIIGLAILQLFSMLRADSAWRDAFRGDRRTR